jgi:integrase
VLTLTLHEALKPKRMSVIREGFVIRNLDGTAKTDTQTVRAVERICRKAGLPVRLWHALRHAPGTHAALFGVNPWRLQTRLRHKRIDETMLYVHVAEAHAREWPEPVREAARREIDPDKWIVAMLGARAVDTNEARGSHVAAKTLPADVNAANAAA